MFYGFMKPYQRKFKIYTVHVMTVMYAKEYEKVNLINVNSNDISIFDFKYSVREGI